jgi:hypothetical protein
MHTQFLKKRVNRLLSWRSYGRDNKQGAFVLDLWKISSYFTYFTYFTIQVISRDKNIAQFTPQFLQGNFLCMPSCIFNKIQCLKKIVSF